MPINVIIISVMPKAATKTKDDPVLGNFDLFYEELPIELKEDREFHESRIKRASKNSPKPA